MPPKFFFHLLALVFFRKSTYLRLAVFAFSIAAAAAAIVATSTLV